jgi:hypothetical protein
LSLADVCSVAMGTIASFAKYRHVLHRQTKALYTYQSRHAATPTFLHREPTITTTCTANPIKSPEACTWCADAAASSAPFLQRPTSKGDMLYVLSLGSAQDYNTRHV